MPALALWMLGLGLLAAGPRTPADHTLGSAVFAGFVLGGFGLFAAVPVTFVVLLPVALLLRRWGRAGPLATTAVGVVAGGPFGLTEGLSAVALYAYCGGAVALAFWAIGRPALARGPGPPQTGARA
jgi:hypothetical protein